jgi:hypothetical protein
LANFWASVLKAVNELAVGLAARAPPMSLGKRLWDKGYAMQGERGAMDIGGVLVMGIGMVFLAVGFIIFPIATTATDALLAYAFTANNTITDASFTGFTAIIGITPLLILIGFLSAAVFSMYLGVQITRGAAGSAKLDLGTMLMLGISIIFIAIGLIILPVALDGVATVLHGGGNGINAAYVGLSPILLVTPLLILISFISGAVITGFFGIRRLGMG